MPHALVIGSGHNGLVAANRLAERGWSVQVIEATANVGGSVQSAELIEAGFVNDICSAFFPLALASPALVDLDLERHGLVWRHAPLVVAHPTLDGSCPVISRDIDETAASLDTLQPGDGEAWRRLYQRWAEIEPALLQALFTPFPPVRAAARLGTGLGPSELLRLARFSLLPARRMGDEEFAGPAARRLLAGAALHADFAPESTLGGFFGWLICSLAQSGGFPVPEGGAARLTDALVRRLASHGGTVTCGTAVEQILVRDRRAVGVRLVDGEELTARRAVIADVSAPMLYRQLLEPDELPRRLLDDLDRFHWDDATVKVDWNLDGPIPWSAEAARRAGTVHVGEGVDALTVGASELARGLVPSHPFMLMGQQSMTDPTRQPAGAETAWAYTHVPRRVQGDSAGQISGHWDRADADYMADRMQAQVEALAPGFTQLVRGRHVMTPPMFEAHNPNQSGSAINGGTAQLHQQLLLRPVPGWGRSETPVRGLFLASGSAHPGGGVHGAAGANAARAAIVADRLRRARRVFGRSAQPAG